MRQIKWMCAMAIVLFVHLLPAQDNKPTYIKLGNGINAILLQRTENNNVTINYTIRTGTVYESDSLSGIAYLVQNILANKVLAALKNNSYGLSFQNTQFTAATFSEQTVYTFVCSAGNMPQCLRLLRDSLVDARCSESEFTLALANLKDEIKLAGADSKHQLETAILQKIFSSDWEKLDMYGNPLKYKFITRNGVQAFINKFYVSPGIIINITGNVGVDDAIQSVENVFRNVLKPAFDPETISKVIDFKPVVYNTTFVFAGENTVPEFQICRQMPGIRSNTAISFAGFLFSAMFNDKDNYIQQKAAKLGCRELRAQYEAQNFSGIFRIIIKADSTNWMAVYNLVIKELNRADEMMINESMVNAGKIIFRREYNELRNSAQYTNWITKYWTFKDESYFPTLLDSVMQVDEKAMRKFATDLIKQNAYTSCLTISNAARQNLKIDSFFTDIEPSVFNHIIKYKQNLTDIPAAADSLQLSRMVMWLKLNPGGSIQVNGFADEGEFNKVYDDSIMNFIDSIPTFQRAMPEQIRKGYLRPEMMRALKVIKYFADAGIEFEKLKGTAMKFSSDTKEDEAANMKVTIQFDYNRRSPTPYEFHYGKK